jgi:uncharacterized repeat protein (TIGR01451 family)
MKRSWRIAVGLGAVLTLLGVGPVAQGGHQAFAVGDVFVGVGSSTVQWRHAPYSTSTNLSTFVNSPSTAGMVVDASGNLYVTGFTSNGISKFGPTGSRSAFGSGYSAHPKSMAADAQGNLYVGLASGSKDVLKMSPAGAVLDNYDVAISQQGGADWIDLSSDGETIFYTNRSREVHRFHMPTKTQMSDFVTGLPGTAQEVRVTLDGGVLVAVGSAIVHVAANGTRTNYGAAQGNCWNNVTLGTTANTFWGADSCSSNVYKFTLGTANGELQFNTGTRRNTVGGLAVFGGLRAAIAGADLAVSKTTEFEQVTSGGTVQYEIEVTNNGPMATGGVTVEDTASQGEITFADGDDWTCVIDGGSASCALDGDLAAGATAPVLEIRVEAPMVAENTTLRNTAVVSGDENDPVSSSNTSVVEITILDTEASKDAVITFCPPGGCQFQTTYNTNDPTNNTSNQVIVPPGGGGGLTTLIEGVTTFPCGDNTEIDDDTKGQETFFDPPPGLNDFQNPIQVITRFQHTVFEEEGELPVPLCMSKDGGNTWFEMPMCTNPSWVNIDPATGETTPCVKKYHQLGQGNTNLDWQVHINMTSDDPAWRR